MQRLPRIVSGGRQISLRVEALIHPSLQNVQIFTEHFLPVKPGIIAMLKPLIEIRIGLEYELVLLRLCPNARISWNRRFDEPPVHPVMSIRGPNAKPA